MSYSAFYLKRQKGAIAAELAVLIPVFLTILVAVIDVALMLRDHQILENATREAARYSSLPKAWVDARNPGATEDQIKDFIINYCSAQDVSVDRADITIDQTHSLSAGGKNFRTSRISVTFERSPLILGSAVELRSEAIFRNLY